MAAPGPSYFNHGNFFKTQAFVSALGTNPGGLTPGSSLQTANTIVATPNALIPADIVGILDSNTPMSLAILQTQQLRTIAGQDH